MASRAQKLARKLRLLHEAESLDDEEVAELLSAARRKRPTRKQLAAAKRNLRRACSKLDKRERPVSKLERRVMKLRAELREKEKTRLLREEEQRLRRIRREQREAKKALRGLSFSILP